MFLVRILVSVSLLVWIFNRVDFSQIVTLLKQINLSLLVLGVILFQIGMFIRTFRWQLLLTSINVFLPFKILLALNYSGAFFNIFLPTGFGGDVLRVVEAGNYHKRQKEQIASIVVLDRFGGFAAIFTLCIISLPISHGLLPGPLYGKLLLLALVGNLITGLVFLQKPIAWVEAWIEKLPRGSYISRYIHPLTELPQRSFAIAWLISLGLQMLIIFIHFLTSQALDATIPLRLFGVFTPIVSLTLLLPSIQGLGVRENVYGMLLSAIGYSISLGVSISLLIYSINVFTGLIGGVIYLLFGVNLALSSSRESQAKRL